MEGNKLLIVEKGPGVGRFCLLGGRDNNFWVGREKYGIESICRGLEIYRL